MGSLWEVRVQPTTVVVSQHAVCGTNENTDAVAFARERLQFTPDAQQELVLRGGRRGIVNCTRQWGKSTVTAAKAVHRACSAAGSLTLVVSPSARQSGEFLRKAKEFVRRLGMRVEGDGDNEMSIALPNGSRIVGLPGNETTVRGFSAVSLLLIDEAARVSDEMYRAMRPMLVVHDGDLWLMSTPNGQARILLGGVGTRRRGVGADQRAGDGVPADFGASAGGGEGERGGPMVPAGISVRVRGPGRRGVFAGDD